MKLGMVAVALSSAAIAAPPKPAARPAGNAGSPMALSPGVRRVPLSPDGNAIAARIMGEKDPRVAQIQMDLAAIRQEKAQFLSGSTVDVDKLEPLMRREEGLQTELRAKQNDRLLELLRALSDPDRVALLQNLASPARAQSSRPAEAGR
ncbi:hypothetical protein [Rhizorhabdus argentea]|uniref:hypothetical protein n=1 Tax=Rhizorhabdus argentea TaxID=1387174 RepID=UPI0030EDEA99